MDSNVKYDIDELDRRCEQKSIIPLGGAFYLPRTEMFSVFFV